MNKKRISIKKVSVILKPRTYSDYVTIIPNLNNWFSKRKIQVQFLKKEQGRISKIFKNIPKNISFISEKELHTQSDLLISLGGDGTFIGLGRKSHKNSPPIYGVNMGKLGFLTEFSKSELYDGLERLTTGQCEYSKVNLFEIEICEKERVLERGYFLNDAVVGKQDISRMFSLSVESGDEHIYNLSGDGLIVSSPLGSTAYSLAAGGPIIHPEVNAMVLTPICPHSLTHRPLVIPDTSEITIKIPKDSESVVLTLDGQEAFNITPKSVIKVRKAKNRYIKIVHNEDKTYYNTLKEKFTHGRRGY